MEPDAPIPIKTNTRGAGDTELICGRLQFDEASRVLLPSTLPVAVVVHVRTDQQLADMRALVRMIEDELHSTRPGALSVASDLSSALFVLMLRTHLEQRVSSSAILRLLGSPVCARAVDAMVKSPARGWSLDTLAAVSHVSRATLVRAFQAAASVTPLAFLAELRLSLGRQRLMTSSEPLSQLAAEVGYTSESAFVRAFSRLYGISPGRLRSRSTELNHQSRS